MDILFITEGAYPESIGGSQTLVYEMARGLKDKGHRVFHLTSSEDTSRPVEEDWEGIKLFRYFIHGKSYLGDAIRLPWSLLSRVKKILKEQPVDVISLNHVMSGFWISLFYGGHHKIIYNFNSPWYREYEIRVRQGKGKLSLWNKGMSLLLKTIQGYLMKRARRIVVLSQYMMELALQFDPLLDRKIVCIRPGISLEEFKPVGDRQGERQRLRIDSSSFIILTVRRLVPRMGLEALIDAMPRILEKHSSVQLWVVGGGMLEQALKEKVRMLKIENHVFILGSKEKKQLIKNYQIADLSVMPSMDLEGFGFSTLESLACGTPVVGTRVGGTVEILEKLNSDFLAERAEPALLAQAIETWIERRNGLDDWRKKARLMVEENYSLGHMADDMEKILTAE